MFADSFRSSLSPFPRLTHIWASQGESLGAPSFGLAGPCMPWPIGTHRKSHSSPILNECQSQSLILALKTFKELLKSRPHFLQKASLWKTFFIFSRSACLCVCVCTHACVLCLSSYSFCTRINTLVFFPCLFILSSFFEDHVQGRETCGKDFMHSA